MSIAETETEAKPIFGKLRYISPGKTPEASPHNLHLPLMSEFGDERLMPLHSLRPVPPLSDLPSSTNHAKLETHGFTAVYCPTTMHSLPYDVSSWKNPELLRQYYIPETVDMMKRVTGCKTVITESLLLRQAIWTESDALAKHGGLSESALDDGAADANQASELETGFPQFIGFNLAHGGVSPAPKIHLDYAPAGARTHLKEFHPFLTEAAADIIKAENSLVGEGKDLKESYRDSNGPRWALFSIWRPLRTVKRDPLALGDQRTFLDDDYVPVDVKYPNLGRPGGGTHETASYLARYSDGQKWHWIEDQRPEEVLIIGLFDSDAEKDGGKAAGGTLHSSVELEGTEQEEARESLECRCLCIW